MSDIQYNGIIRKIVVAVVFSNIFAEDEDIFNDFFEFS